MIELPKLDERCVSVHPISSMNFNYDKFKEINIETYYNKVLKAKRKGDF